jgi:hypothetical protein
MDILTDNNLEEIMEEVGSADSELSKGSEGVA